MNLRQDARIRIVDYGQGNLGSIRNMLLRLGAESEVTQDPAEIETATHLILPGVGAFDRGMKAIADRGLREVLDIQALERRIPVLGICLGAQLMTRGSEEGGGQPGFGWFNAEARRFKFEPPAARRPIPNIGWRTTRAERPDTLARGLEDECRFYYVHSYYLVADDPRDVALTASYGAEFAAGLQRDNLYSAQFHPEKSHRFGMTFLRNFVHV
ncbi:imidazole glycerol phosphate synthase subunit HisH [Brevundimonas sp. UBA7664]|uniref:imidazole glycerol phosphate synthase subunit HisH n=1 Tax=Brevundimonas sp. UBA7664 TaxID=1946141 RepID=UPI0025C51049|nr:imidazole glycerol phosphate synthase subunit HisH [Brevundimonas sp. UBA7664]